MERFITRSTRAWHLSRKFISHRHTEFSHTAPVPARVSLRFISHRHTELSHTAPVPARVSLRFRYFCRNLVTTITPTSMPSALLPTPNPILPSPTMDSKGMTLMQRLQQERRQQLIEYKEKQSKVSPEGIPVHLLRKAVFTLYLEEWHEGLVT